jgi:hypothetical protein
VKILRIFKDSKLYLVFVADKLVTFSVIGIGKRDSDLRRPKFGQSYKWIGLGKRDSATAKFNPGYKWIGLGKRYAPFAASAHMLAHMTNFKELFNSPETNKNRISRTSTGSGGSAGRSWKPFYSVVTKKYGTSSESSNSASDEETSLEAAPKSAGSIVSGRPNVRGGPPNNFEPIYRFIGLG